MNPYLPHNHCFLCFQIEFHLTSYNNSKNHLTVEFIYNSEYHVCYFFNTKNNITLAEMVHINVYRRSDPNQVSVRWFSSCSVCSPKPVIKTPPVWNIDKDWHSPIQWKHEETVKEKHADTCSQTDINLALCGLKFLYCILMCFLFVCIRVWRFSPRWL